MTETGLQDSKPFARFVCYSASSKDSSSSTKATSSLPKVFSGKPYSIGHYVTCDKFSKAHENYLAAISKVVEPRYFHEAVQDPK